MSYIPLILSDWLEDQYQPPHIAEPTTARLALRIRPEQLDKLDEFLAPLTRRAAAAAAAAAVAAAASASVPTSASTDQATKFWDKDKFQVVIDVQQFEPEEIDVKVTDEFVVVTAKHDEKRDQHGWIARQFVRKYAIPEQCDIDQITSKLSSDGVLTISAPRKGHGMQDTERIIKIERTGKPAVQSESSSCAKLAAKLNQDG